MKTRYWLGAVAAAASLALAACGGDGGSTAGGGDEGGGNGGAGGAPSGLHIAADVDGVEVYADQNVNGFWNLGEPGDTSGAGNSLSANTTPTVDGVEAWGIAHMPAATGQYLCSDGSVSISLTVTDTQNPDNNTIYLADETSGTCTVDVTEVDEDEIVGEFKATMVNQSDPDGLDEAEVTNGTFRVRNDLAQAT